ncbi:hypothetical protein WJX73_004022 [Symbiochloris irregularis]|uniref:Replication protein A C-terminal domain-containing protein n=1 Tax=Symbiochloris irregularis TaxID=706552 RepID=A0AAW1NPL8_9CHLO
MMDSYNAGASQFAGGGFMPSQGQADGGGLNSPAQKRAGSQTSTLRAVTIKQLFDGAQNSSDDIHMVDNQEIQNVTLVGKLLSCDELSTQLKLRLDDGTGTAEVCHWIDADQEPEQLAQKKADWRPGVYARVHGNMRNFENKRTIVAFSIRPIVDFNELTYHLLSCMFQHAYFTTGSATAPAPMGGLGPSAQMAPTMPQYGGDQAGGANMTPVQRAVIGIFQKADSTSSQGITTGDLANALAGQFSAQEIQNAVTHLVEEGHVYTTIDEFHFRFSGS